jgi:hypothetical protein
MRIVWTCAAIVLLAGCGGGGGKPAATTCPPLTGARTSATNTARPAETILLTGVSIDATDCVDRVEFAFKPTAAGPPGYRISYLPADRALVEDGSGAPIAVKGTAYLVVRFEPAATADISSEVLQRTYTGPKRLAAPPGAHAVREVVKSGDFEAVLTWVIGVDGHRPFTVTITGSRVVLRIT